MQTFFNTDELGFIQNRHGFETKIKASQKTVTCLNELDRYLRSHSNLLCFINERPSKITKGENLLGYPFFVLDIPALTLEAEIFSIRIIVWWGNYIGVHLLLGETIFPTYRDVIKNNFTRNNQDELFISRIESFWKHDVLNTEHYTKADQFDTEFLKAQKNFKAALLLPLDAINDIESLAAKVSDLNNLLV